MKKLGCGCKKAPTFKIQMFGSRCFYNLLNTLKNLHQYLPLYFCMSLYYSLNILCCISYHWNKSPVDWVKSYINATCREVYIDFAKLSKKGKSNLILKWFSLNFLDADRITWWAKSFNKIRLCLLCHEESNKADDRAGSYVLWDAAEYSGLSDLKKRRLTGKLIALYSLLRRGSGGEMLSSLLWDPVITGWELLKIVWGQVWRFGHDIRKHFFTESMVRCCKNIP